MMHERLVRKLCMALLTVRFYAFYRLVFSLRGLAGSKTNAGLSGLVC